MGGKSLGLGYLMEVGLRFKVQGSRFKVQGSRFKVQGSRFKVQGSLNISTFSYLIKQTVGK